MRTRLGKEQGQEERAKSRKQEEESGEELGATAMQWGMACGNKSRVLSAQQELRDTGTAHGSDMRDMDHETCKSPTGNVSTNHLCSPRANFGYTGRTLVLGSLFDGCLPGSL